MHRILDIKNMLEKGERWGRLGDYPRPWSLHVVIGEAPARETATLPLARASAEDEQQGVARIAPGCSTGSGFYAASHTSERPRSKCAKCGPNTWNAQCGGVTYIFEAVEVLVSLIADLTRVGLLFLHAKSTRVWYTRVWVDNGESAVLVLVQLLVRVSMSFVISVAFL
jgi:hypothetical protein